MEPWIGKAEESTSPAKETWFYSLGKEQEDRKAQSAVDLKEKSHARLLQKDLTG